MTDLEQTVGVWIKHRPGLFESRSERECWAKIKADIEHDLGEGFLILNAVRYHGLDVRATPVGGYILDWK